MSLAMRLRMVLVIAVLTAAGSHGSSALAAEDPCRAAQFATQVARAYEARGADGALEALHEGDPWRVALVLCARGQHAAAVALAGHDAALAEQVAQWRTAPLAPDLVRALDAADVAFESDRPEEAARLFAALPSDDGFVAAWARLYGILAQLGPDALDALDAVRVRADALHWGQGVAAALGVIAEIAREQAAYERSLAAYEALIEHHGARGELGLQARVRMDHASTLALLGDHRRAVAGFSAVLAVLGDDEPLRMDALYNLGFVRYLLGDYARALASQEAARALAEHFGADEEAAECTTRLAEIELRLGAFDRAVARAKGAIAQLETLEAPARLAEAWTALGDALEQRGDLEESAQAYQRATKLSEALPEGSAYNIAIGALNLGVVRRRQGRHEEARALLGDALPRLEALRVEAGVAWALRELALLDAAEGRHAQALARLDRALAIAEARDEAETIVRILGARMEVHEAAGDPDALMDTADRAGAVLQRLVRGLAETQGALARRQRAHIHALAMRTAIAANKPERFVTFLERSRAGGLAEALANRRSIREALIPDDLRREEERAVTAQAIARTRYLSARRLGVRDARREAFQGLEAARARTREVQERIQRAGKANALYAPVASLEDVRGVLRDGDALVLFAVLEREVVAAIVTKAGLRTRSLGPRAAIEDACAALDLGDPDRPAPLEAVQRLVVAPLGLDKARRVLVSPDAMLHGVPFHALLGTRDVAYVASGTVLSLLAPESSLRGEGILALGDPVDAALPRLHASGPEARAIGTTVLLREEATKAALQKAASAQPRWRALHFACHGLPDDEEPMASSLALTDGRLTALDVLQMQMPADLVVLSACETGKGRYVRGEGLLGLTRAFRIACGPRTIVSLWKVDDAATSALMSRFYQLLEKHPAPTALRLAQAHVASQAKWAHPYYWAAWQLWGPLD